MMKSLKFIVMTLALMLFVITTNLSAQQSEETNVKVEQIETIPLDNMLVGTASGNAFLERIAANIKFTPADGTWPVDDVKAALDDNRSAIAALQAGGSDGVVTAIDVTGTSTKTFTATRSVGGPLSTSWPDEVNDADANATNEIQAVTENGNEKTLSLGGGSWNASDVVVKEVFAPTTGNTISLVNTPSTTYINSMEIRRNGVEQTVDTSGSSSDVTVNGSTLTFNYRNFESGEIVVVKFVAQ